MNRDVKIKLISTTYTADSVGNQIATETVSEIYAKLDTIGQREFFEANQQGLKAEYRFIIYDFEYSGQKILEYAGVKYQIYRTFNLKDERVELYCTKKVGV
jgi:SPP1 family predicted phage head-tail adaptor